MDQCLPRAKGENRDWLQEENERTWWSDRNILYLDYNRYITIHQLKIALYTEISESCRQLYVKNTDKNEILELTNKRVNNPNLFKANYHIKMYNTP